MIMLVLSLALVSCKRDEAPPKSPELAEVMPNVPMPPQPTFVSRSGGADAVQLTVRSPARADAVAAYYRDVFKRNGWRLVNDAKDRDGAVVILAQQDGPPLWVRIRNAEDGQGSLIDLTGARVARKDQKSDSNKPPAPPAAKPTY
jgi:hypothetical protein